jgi:hypothetical protein
MSGRSVKPEERFARMLEVDAAATAIAGSDAAIAPMIMLASALRTAGASSAPSPLAADARAAMRQRLVAVATVQNQDVIADRLRQRNSARVGSRMQKRLVALGGSITIFTGIAGVGIAAAHSLPGDPFYDVKRATESVQLYVAQGNAAKGARHLEFARERLAEAKALPAGSSHLTSTLSSMNAETTAGRNDLVAAYHSSNSTKPLTELATFAQQQYIGLVQLASTTPATLRSTEVTSLNVLGGVATTVKTLSGQSCLTCLITGTGPGGKGAPNGTGTGPNGQHPAPGSSPGAHPSTSPSAPTSPPSSPAITTPRTPGNPIKSILPTIKVSPLKLLHHLLGGTGSKKATSHKTPKPNPIATLLNGLGL